MTDILNTRMKVVAAATDSTGDIFSLLTSGIKKILRRMCTNYAPASARKLAVALTNCYYPPITRNKLLDPSSPSDHSLSMAACSSDDANN